MIVVDASALAKYILREDGWRRVRSLLENFEAYSIDHVVKEVANAIWKRASLLKTEDAKTAQKRFDALLRLVRGGVLILHNEMEYLDDAFRIALKFKVTVYDALYIAQAVRLGAQLVTSDEGQAIAAERAGVYVLRV